MQTEGIAGTDFASTVEWPKLVEHEGIAPSTPVWKVLAHGQNHVSLNTYARKFHQDGFAGRRVRSRPRIRRPIRLAGVLQLATVKA